MEKVVKKEDWGILNGRRLVDIFLGWDVKGVVGYISYEFIGEV